MPKYIIHKLKKQIKIFVMELGCWKQRFSQHPPPPPLLETFYIYIHHLQHTHKNVNAIVFSYIKSTQFCKCLQANTGTKHAPFTKQYEDVLQSLYISPYMSHNGLANWVRIMFVKLMSRAYTQSSKIPYLPAKGASNKHWNILTMAPWQSTLCICEEHKWLPW